MQGKTVTDVTSSFDIGRDEETGAFLVRTRPEAEEHTVCKRRVSLTGNKYGNEETTGLVAMTVKMGAAKFTQSAKTVNAFSSPDGTGKETKNPTAHAVGFFRDCRQSLILLVIANILTRGKRATFQA